MVGKTDQQTEGIRAVLHNQQFKPNTNPVVIDNKTGSIHYFHQNPNKEANNRARAKIAKQMLNKFPDFSL